MIEGGLTGTNVWGTQDDGKEGLVLGVGVMLLLNLIRNTIYYHACVNFSCTVIKTEARIL